MARVRYVFLIGVAVAVSAAAASKEVERIGDATFALQRELRSPRTSIPATVMRNARAIAVFPKVRRDGPIHLGPGIVGSRDTRGRWLPPGFVSLGRAVPANKRLQMSDIILVAITRRGFDYLALGEFVVPEHIQVPAGPIGRDTRLDIDADILAYARLGGLFVGTNLAELAVREDRVAMKSFYGVQHSLHDVLFGFVVRAPAAAEEWRRPLDLYYRELQ